MREMSQIQLTTAETSCDYAQLCYQIKNNDIICMLKESIKSCIIHYHIHNDSFT